MQPEKHEPQGTVRYSEKFLREQKKEERRYGLLVAILVFALSMDYGLQSLYAYRNHTEVDIGSHINHPMMYPPIVGGLVAMLLFFGALYLVWHHFRR